MKSSFLLLFTSLFLVSCDTSSIQSSIDSFVNPTSNSLSAETVGKGLKQALEIGITEGANKLSMTDGYFKSPYKILLPEEVRVVTDKLKNVPGFTNVESILLEKLNRGAEDAAKKAAPIFKKAITDMTFTDAWNILKGNQDAATTYLKKSTSQELYTAFNPVIVESLDKYNARTYWSSVVSKYNKLPFVDPVEEDLDNYVTQKALEGLFSMVETKEKDIRTNVSARSTDLLKQVFARQD